MYMDMLSCVMVVWASATACVVMAMPTYVNDDMSHWDRS